MPEIDIEVRGRAALIKLNAPPLNILTVALQDALCKELQHLRGRDDFNVLILTSSSARGFSGGADVAEHLGRENCERMLSSASALIAELLRQPVPTVAAVHGACLGGAFELALACDQIVATPDATFGTPEITLGCFPPAGLVLMPRKLPPLLASELIQTGRVITAGELQSRGGGLRLADNLEAAVAEIAEAYGSLPRGPLVEATRLLRSGASERFVSAVGGIERSYLERLLTMPDAAEGPNAFLAKRKPEWDHTMGEEA